MLQVLNRHQLFIIVVGNLALACNHKETVCNKCGKIGHLQKVCCRKKTTSIKTTEQPVSKNSTEQSRVRKGVHTVVDKETDEYRLLTVASPGKDTPWSVIIDIEGTCCSLNAIRHRILTVSHV